MSGSGDSNNSGRSLSLKDFRFTTIGKEPALLTRMFDSPTTPIGHDIHDQDDIYEDHPPLPPNPSHSVTENHANGACTRRTLLETLGGADVTRNVLGTERSAMDKVEHNNVKNSVPPTATPHRTFMGSSTAFPPNSSALGSSYAPNSAGGSSSASRRTLASKNTYRAPGKSHNTQIVSRLSDRRCRAHSVPRSFPPDDDPSVSSDEEPTLADLRCLQERLAVTISNLRPIDNSRAVKLVLTLKDQCKTVFTTARQSQRLARQALENAQQAVATAQICLSVAESIQPHANEVLSAVRRLGHCHGDRGPGREWNSLLEGLEDNLQQLEQWTAKREAYEMRREVEEREAELSRMQLPRSASRGTGKRPLSLSPPVTSTNRAPDADITMTSVGEKAEGTHGAWSRQVPEPSDVEDDIRKRNRANSDFQDVGEKPTALLESAKRNSEAKTTRQSEEDQTVQVQLETKELERKISEVLKRQLKILDEEKQRQGSEDFEASKRQQAEAELETAKRRAESEEGKHLEAEVEAAKRLQEEQGSQEKQQQPTENSNAVHRGKEKEIPLVADNGTQQSAVTPHILGKTASPVSLLRPVRLTSTAANSKIGNVTSKKTLADYFGHGTARQRKKANKPHIAPLQVVSNTEAVSTPSPSQDGRASDSGHNRLPSVADNQLTHSPSPPPSVAPIVNNDSRLSPLLSMVSSTGIDAQQQQQQVQPITPEKQPVPLSTTSHASITQTETETETEACQSTVDIPPPATPQKVRANPTDFDLGNVVRLRAKIISPKARYKNWKRIHANAGLLDTPSIKPEPLEQKAKLNTEENKAHTPPRSTLNSSMSLPPNAEFPAGVATATDTAVKPELECPVGPQTSPGQAKLGTISLQNVSRAKSPAPAPAICVSTSEQSQRSGDNPLNPPQTDLPSSIIPSAPSTSTEAPLNVANTEVHSPNPPETISLFDRMQCTSIPSPDVLHPSPSSESRIIITTQSPPVASSSSHGTQLSSTVPLVLRVEQPDHPYMQDPDEQMGPDLMTSSWNDQGDDMHDERHQFQSRPLEDNRRSRSPPPPSVVKRLPSKPGIELLKHNPYVPARRYEPSPPLHRGRRRSFSGTGSMNSSRDVSSNPRSHAVSPNPDSRATSSNPQKCGVPLNPESHAIVSNPNGRKSKSPGSRFSVSPSRPIAGQKRMREDDSVPGPSPRRSRNRGPSHSAPFASRYANMTSGSSQIHMGDGVAMRMEHPGSFQERSNYLNNRQPPGQPLTPRMNPSSQSPERRMQPRFRPQFPHQNRNRHYDDRHNNPAYIPQQRGRDNHTPDLLNRISDFTDVRPHSQPNSGRQHVHRRPFNRGRGRGRGRGASTGGVGFQRVPGNPPALIDRFQDS